MSEFTMLNVMLNLMDTSQWLTNHHSEHFPRLTTVKSRRFGKITSTIFQKFPSCVHSNTSARRCHNLAFAKYLDFKFSDV